MDRRFMDIALQEAYDGISRNHGGPFGSVVVRHGEVVGRGHNRVIVNNDPTCHGEIEAIRDACKNLGTYDLSGCELYTTAEPCPMCLGAIMWARLKKVYYGCTRLDTADIGFRDDDMYKEFAGEQSVIRMYRCDRDSCLELFEKYRRQRNKETY